MFCKCKFSCQINEDFIFKAYIDIPLVAYEDIRINTIDKLFKEYIYILLYVMSLNVLVKKIKILIFILKNMKL